MGNNDDIKTRLKKVLETKRSNVSKITEGEDVKRSTLSAQINGSSAVSYETIKLFLRKFTDLSANWLINGVGPMFDCCKNSAPPEAPFMLGESEPETSRTEKEKDDRIRFLEQQLKLEKDKSALLQQQLNLYEGRV